MQPVTRDKIQDGILFIRKRFRRIGIRFIDVICVYVQMYVSGSSTITCVECYDADYNEWYDASPMNLSRSAVSACVIAGLPNAREYSYLGKARDLGQGRCNIRHGGFCRESQRR